MPKELTIRRDSSNDTDSVLRLMAATIVESRGTSLAIAWRQRLWTLYPSSS